MNWRAVVVSLTVVSVVVGVGGCFSANDASLQAFRRPDQSQVSTDTYILQPPDYVEVFCADIPELNLQTQRIRPDGKISFEGVGELMAAGKTCEQLSQDIRQKVAGLYNLTGDRPIDVRVTLYFSKSYYVIGQVRAGGAKNYTGRDTVLNALAMAGPTNLAWLEQIQVIRPSSDPCVPAKVYRLNFDRMSAHGDNTRNMLLEEGDIIYVPPTVLAWVGLKLEELLGPIFRTYSTANVVDPSRTNDYSH
jgi:protein involved in polysaccharide export with SLBB domain